MHDVKERALKLLKKRDKTEHEIKETLSKDGYDEIQIEETIEYLKNLRYIDDYEYALRFIEISMDKNRGPLRITKELAVKGISSDVIEDALYERMSGQWEWDTARSIADGIKSKYPSLSEEKLLAKIVNKLSYEGFSEEVISDVAEDFYSENL